MLYKLALVTSVIALNLALSGCGRPGPSATPSAQASSTAVDASQIIEGDWRLINFGAPW